jgi:hypothetical protein
MPIASREEARDRLNELNAAIGLAAELIRANADVLDQFFAEKASMDSVGPILDPTLFNSSERRAIEAVLEPVYEAARDFVRAYDVQIAAARAALAKAAAA